MSGRLDDRTGRAEEGGAGEKFHSGSRGPHLDTAEPELGASLKNRSRRIFEVDPLSCPQCQVEMRVVSVIQEAAVIDRLLAHLRRIGGNGSSRAARGDGAAGTAVGRGAGVTGRRRVTTESDGSHRASTRRA